MDPKKINFLESLRINVPKRVYYKNEIKENPPFKECSLRLFSAEITDYRQVEEALRELKEKGIIKDFSLSTKVPVFIYYLSPCKIKELVEKLKLNNFEIEAYDVTNKDVIASVIVKKDENTLHFEGENKGYIRRITREGIVEFKGKVEKARLTLEGEVKHKEVFELLSYLWDNLEKFPKGLVEFTIHKNPHGKFGQKFIAWEYLPVQ